MLSPLPQVLQSCEEKQWHLRRRATVLWAKCCFAGLDKLKADGTGHPLSISSHIDIQCGKCQLLKHQTHPSNLHDATISTPAGLFSTVQLASYLLWLHLQPMWGLFTETCYPHQAGLAKSQHVVLLLTHPRDSQLQADGACISSLSVSFLPLFLASPTPPPTFPFFPAA